MVDQTSPISARPLPNSSCHQEFLSHHQPAMVLRQTSPGDIFSGPILWRQMMIGFTCAGFIGLVMLVLGTIFIAEAISEDQPITVMLCVMGIVFGIIILAGTIILGRLLISRKWVKCQGRDSAPSHCLYHCSVIYSPSLDQIGGNEPISDPPPSYTSVASPQSSQPVTSLLSVAAEHHHDETEMSAIMVLPPKYEEASRPPPEYESDKSKDEERDSLPPYED